MFHQHTTRNDVKFDSGQMFWNV